MQDKQQQAKWEKLARLLSGNATEEDAAASKNGEVSEEELRQAKGVWEKTGAKEGWEPDTDAAWKRFTLKTMAREQQHVTDPEITPLQQPNSRSPLRWWMAAAAAVLLLMVGIGVVRMQTSSPELIEVATAAGQREEVLLPDGSRVWLNEGSALAYAPGFSADHREVGLQGEAFFEVAKAEGKRFTILAGGTRTEVIGTSFNLKAYAGEAVTVQVVTGRVAFADAILAEAVFLGPGEEARLQSEGSRASSARGERGIERRKIEDPNFRAWQNRELHFANTSLEQLSQTLSDYYGVEIRLQDSSLRNCRFTAHFADARLEEVLEVLRITGNFSIRQTPAGYQISGEGCQ